MILCSSHFIALRISLNLSHYLVDLFELEINNIIHYTLGISDVCLELIKIETSLFRERIYNVTVQVNT